jgi:glucose-6-phosphate-specific signal transduction histidine kinase
MNQPMEVGQAVDRTDSPARAPEAMWRPAGMALCWMAAAALACLALGTDLPERFASWLAAVWHPETLGVMLSTAVGMATWVAASRGWAEEGEDLAPPSPQDLIRGQLAARDRLGRGVVEANERRQQHFRQSLEIGLVRQLSGVSVLAGLLEQRLSAQHRPEAAEVAKLRELVERTISEARLLAAAAHPPEIETEGLEAALRKMAGAAEKYHVYCRVVQDSCCLPPDAASALQLYRIVQVIVERAVRHGEAHHILVELTAGPEKYMSMVVIDRVGHGDQLPPLSRSELGDLQARARSIGATLQVDHPAGGLRLTCRLIAKGPKLQA